MRHRTRRPEIAIGNPCALITDDDLRDGERLFALKRAGARCQVPSAACDRYFAAVVRDLQERDARRSSIAVRRRRLRLLSSRRIRSARVVR